MAEPGTTAILLVTLGVLLLASAFLSRVAGRAGVPVPLLFLLLGMLVGSEGLGHIHFSDVPLAFRGGVAALALILFDGGFHTELGQVKKAIFPAAVLATAGVVVTAAVTAAGAHLLGLPLRTALLFGAIVSSTDAATVFSVLRGGAGQPRRRVSAVLELESGLNDPMAVILTLTLMQVPIGAGRAVAEVALQIGVGVAGGLGLGFGGRWLLRSAHLPVRGLYPVLTVGLALVGFAVPTLLWGSGFLAVYLVGIVLGNGRLPDRPGISRVHDSLAWFGQIGMFLLLGLLVVPSHLPPRAGVAVPAALVVAIVARPLAVLLCLLPFGYSAREILYIGWVGLRGAVPIILATFPVLGHVPGSEELFDLVFFVVVVGAIVPGLTVRRVARWLRLEGRQAPPPTALLEITSTETLGAEVLSFYIEPASAASGATIADLPFPERSAVMLVIRGKELIAPRGGTVISPGDHVYVLCRSEDRPLVQLILGRQEAE